MAKRQCMYIKYGYECLIAAKKGSDFCEVHEKAGYAARSIYNIDWDGKKKGEVPKPKPKPKLTPLEKQLLKALEHAQEHLQYCSYGDSWEREGAMAQGLPGIIEKAIAKAKGEVG